jgi:MOSC domain-containing protein YiiM
MKSRIVSVNRSEGKGTRKQPLLKGFLTVEHGLEGDAHAGSWHRQISLLAQESIEKMQGKGFALQPGDFAENLTTEGIELLTLPVGTRLRIGAKVRLEVTQIGKECHFACEIRQLVGDCVMPREGIFARVLQGGEIQAGDPIAVEPKEMPQ